MRSQRLALHAIHQEGHPSSGLSNLITRGLGGRVGFRFISWIIFCSRPLLCFFGRRCFFWQFLWLSLSNSKFKRPNKNQTRIWPTQKFWDACSTLGKPSKPNDLTFLCKWNSFFFTRNSVCFLDFGSPTDSPMIKRQVLEVHRKIVCCPVGVKQKGEVEHCRMTCLPYICKFGCIWKWGSA